MVEKDRSNSVLTDSQREYLRGDRSLSDSAERMARKRIRERLQAAIFDVGLIVSESPVEDIDDALSMSDAAETPLLESAIQSLLVLLYLYHREQEDRTETKHDGWLTARDVESGIKMALTKAGAGYEDVSVEIEVERTRPVEELADGDLSDLSRDQLTEFLRAGVIDGDEFAEAWDAKDDD
jgi:hypothetical protein